MIEWKEGEKMFCQGCYGDLTAEENELYDGFCTKCDSEEWHYCEKCAKPTNYTIYDTSIGILLCEECSKEEVL